MAAIEPYNGPRSLTAAVYDLVRAGEMAVHADRINRGTTGRGSSSARRR
jgi:hypothetical protein